jgi:hypothetical protein
VAVRACRMVMGSIVVRAPEPELPDWNCALTSRRQIHLLGRPQNDTLTPPDSPPSSLATCARLPPSPRRELLQSAKRPARHSVSGFSKDVLHDLYI